MKLKLKNNIAKICDATFKVFLSEVWKVGFSHKLIFGIYWNLPPYFLQVPPCHVQFFQAFPVKVDTEPSEFRKQFFLASRPNIPCLIFVRNVTQLIKQWNNGLFTSFNLRSRCLLFAQPPTKQLNAETEYATNN